MSYPSFYSVPSPYPVPYFYPVLYNQSGSGLWFAVLIILFILLLSFGGYWCIGSYY